jgi:[protein-PII] uridylyltransferase
LEYCAARAEVLDAWLASLFDRVTAHLGRESSRFALVAVGGYGRREMCPGSDVDLMLLSDDVPSGAELAPQIWYPIWNSGLSLDHSVRTVQEAVEVASQDAPAALGLLDARCVAGNAEMVNYLTAHVSTLWKTHYRRLLLSLAELAEQRRQTHRELAFVLEPDLKQSYGGLRDLRSLATAADMTPVVRPALARADLPHCLEVLIETRVALHSVTARPHDRLLLQDQPAVADYLGIADPELLMEQLARVGRVLAFSCDDAWHRLRASVPPVRHDVGVSRPLEAHVVLRDGEVDLTTPAEPTEAIKAAAIAAELQLPLSHQVLDRLAEAAGPVLVFTPEVTNDLVRLLATGGPAIPLMEALDHFGLLSRLIPEWSAVQSRPQRNAYHRYTVDRHLLETAANAAQLVDRVSRPDLLLISSLLHDLGKGYPGDHSLVGSGLAATVAGRMGLPPLDALSVGELVRHHLLLADTATRRDISDPATVAMVIAKVPDPDQLRLLWALTEADSLATGPAAWGKWKERLVSDLVAACLDQMGHPTERLIPAAPPAQLGSAQAGSVSVEAAADADGVILTVYIPDRPGGLACVAAVLSMSGLDIRSATLTAAGPDRAIEVFRLGTIPSRLPDLARLAERLASGLARGDGIPASPVSQPRPGHPESSVECRFDCTASASTTWLEVRAPDQPGTLARIAQALADAGLDVVSARVNSIGHFVVDTFYVRYPESGRPTSAEQLAAIEVAIRRHLE